MNWLPIMNQNITTYNTIHKPTKQKQKEETLGFNNGSGMIYWIIVLFVIMSVSYMEMSHLRLLTAHMLPLNISITPILVVRGI